MQKPKYTYFFDKQPAYEQLSLKWQIAKQISGLNPLSLSFFYNKNKTATRQTIHQNSGAWKALLGKF